MVSLDIIYAETANIVQAQPLVAVFVGGTSGIGEHAARALASTDKKHNGKGLRVYIVGRNAPAAQQIMKDCLETCPNEHFEFVQGDVSLLKEVDRVCDKINTIETDGCKVNGVAASIDLLVMSQATFEPFRNRSDTKEGLDMATSLLYYSRMRFITRLLPLLLESQLPAHVLSIVGPGRDKTLIADDLSLRDPKNYSFLNSGSHAAYLKTCFFEKLAAEHCGRLSLIHYFSGLVLTNAFESPTLPIWFKWVFRIVRPVLQFLPVSVSQDEAGERILFLASSRFPAREQSSLKAPERIPDAAMSSDGIIGGGAYRVNWDGSITEKGTWYDQVETNGLTEKFWNHTMQASDEIEAGRVFEDYM